MEMESNGICFGDRTDKVANGLDIGDRSEKEKSRVTSRFGTCSTS